MVLEKRRALVCGSSQGIGRAVAMALAGMGAEIILVARDAERLEKVREELDRSEGRVHRFLVADFGEPEKLGETVRREIGESGPVHILINNTGGPPGGPVLKAGAAEFSDAFAKHLLCNHTLVQLVVEEMKKAGYGRIINIISTSVKQPLPNLGVSNTIRAAVANWSKTLAGELAPFGITVNNVLPGATRTQRLEGIFSANAQRRGKSVTEIQEEMLSEIPMKRFADPGEIAAAVAFLASPSASYITGINIPVDGGRTGCL